MSADKTVPPAAEEKKEDNKSFDEDIKHSDPVEIRAEDTSKPFDVFLSHNWGNDTRGKSYVKSWNPRALKLGVMNMTWKVTYLNPWQKEWTSLKK